MVTQECPEMQPQVFTQILTVIPFTNPIEDLAPTSKYEYSLTKNDKIFAEEHKIPLQEVQKIINLIEGTVRFDLIIGLPDLKKILVDVPQHLDQVYAHWRRLRT